MLSENDNYWRRALENEVVSIYKRVRAAATTPLTHRELCKLVTRQPASRFYISPELAWRYCRKRDSGAFVFKGRSFHHSLLEAFYDVVVVELHNASFHDNLSQVIARAINRPAPCLGIGYRAVEDIIHRKLHIHHKRPNRVKK